MSDGFFAQSAGDIYTSYLYVRERTISSPDPVQGKRTELLSNTKLTSNDEKDLAMEISGRGANFSYDKNFIANFIDFDVS